MPDPIKVNNLHLPIFKLAARIPAGYGLDPFVSMASGITAQNQEKFDQNYIGINAIHPLAALGYRGLHTKALSREIIGDAKANYLIVCPSDIRN
jgi:hypothetical protein